MNNKKETSRKDDEINEKDENIVKQTKGEIFIK